MTLQIGVNGEVWGLTADKIAKAVQYCMVLEQHTTERTNELARRMGINPVTDLLMLPASYVKRFGVGRLPKWVMTSDFIHEARLLRHVRNDKAKRR